MFKFLAKVVDTFFEPLRKEKIIQFKRIRLTSTLK